MRALYAWAVALVCALGLSAYLARAMTSGDRRMFLPGETSGGHHQIEERCELCHSESFSDADVIQSSCVDCHAAELREADDSHPRSKFTDPRNADRIEVLDARYCVSCHREHVPDATGRMGLTLPDDYCFHCHQDVGEERETHVDLAFDGCADAGCHNFHDNRALYEDFLVRHGAEKDLLEVFDFAVWAPGERKGEALGLSDVDAPTDSVWRPSVREVSTWASAVHARASVNCSACHAPEPGAKRSLGAQRSAQGAAKDASWQLGVGVAVCGECHEREREGFESGRHGMRWAAELEPMRPASARVETREAASERVLDCTSCHGAHLFDAEYASTEACLECHSDRHSLAFEGSPHATWRPARAPARDGSGLAPALDPLSAAAGEGDTDARISCATCHLPRVVGAGGRSYVEHNQNHNLRPNEKMIREVCMDCHGLSFSIDALADSDLIDRNFDRSPSLHVPSVDWAMRRVESDSQPSR